MNLNGELVGINTASFNPRGSMAGNIGLASRFPPTSRNIMGQLIANKGVVRRGTLGVETRDVDAPGAGAGPGRRARRGGDAGVPGFGGGGGRRARAT